MERALKKNDKVVIFRCGRIYGKHPFQNRVRFRETDRPSSIQETVAIPFRTGFVSERFDEVSLIRRKESQSLSEQGSFQSH